MTTIMPGLLYPHFKSEDLRYSKDTKTLVRHKWGKSFPGSVFVKSKVTGRVLRFNVIDDTHPKFDMDQWDGEQQVYAPDTYIPGAEDLILVLSNG